MADDLATELLVRILRDQKIDARHVSLEDLNAPPPDAKPGNIAVVHIVSAFPSEERERGQAVADAIRQRLPHVRLVTLFMPGMVLQSDAATGSVRDADNAATSFGQAVQICLAMQSEAATAAVAHAG
jgi:hypothetical protein